MICVLIDSPNRYNYCSHFQFIDLSPDQFLVEANISRNEVHEIMKRFQPVKATFKSLSQSFQNVTPGLNLTELSESRAFNSK